MGVMDVTVVVCTYNRAALLRDALASLQALEKGDDFRYEILVVNNASTDDTDRAVAECARGSPVPLRGVYEPRAVVGLLPLGEPPGTARRRRDPGEGVREPTVLPLQQLEHTAPGREQYVGQVGVRIQQGQRPARLAASHQPRGDRQARPLGLVARRPQRDRPAEAPAQAAYGVVLHREGMAGVDRHVVTLAAP